MFIPIPILAVVVFAVTALVLRWFVWHEAVRQATTDRTLPEDPEWREFFRRARVTRWKDTGALAWLLVLYLAGLAFVVALASPSLVPGVNDTARGVARAVSGIVVGFGLFWFPLIVLFWWLCQLWLIEPLVERGRQAIIRQRRRAESESAVLDRDLARLRRRADGVID